MFHCFISRGYGDSIVDDFRGCSGQRLFLRRDGVTVATERLRAVFPKAWGVDEAVVK